jgi:N-acetylmuramoyl-L-alanine amidase
VDDLPLVRDSSGESVRDLQRRLAAIGYPGGVIESGRFGPRTEAALRDFQTERGLRPTGECDGTTWAGLVEAGYRLGDRLVYLRSPMLRGDDVAELQRRLGALGFDAGRVDGIFGPATEAAVKDFERNAGLTTDGVCGRDVVAELERLGPKGPTADVVAGVRERERLLHGPRAVQGRRIAVGDAGGLGVLADALAKSLHDAGATVAVLHHPDPSTQAVEANHFEAEVFIGMALDERGPSCVAFYSTPGFESAGGHRLADLVVGRLTAEAGIEVDRAKGMRLPILRETRMPAVMCYLGPPPKVVAASTTLARGLARALGQWVATPVDR